MANKETIHVPARQLQVVGATLDELKTKLLENEIGWSEADKSLFYKTAGGDVLPVGGGTKIYHEVKSRGLIDELALRLEPYGKNFYRLVALGKTETEYGVLIPAELFNKENAGKFLRLSQGSGLDLEFADAPSADGKVRATAESVAGYLSEILKADTDNVEIKAVGNVVRIGLNLSGESDPKLKTVDESLINANTSNYGSYWGDMPEWGGTNVNVLAYRGERTSDAQGSLTRARFALTGSFGSANPIFRIGIFSLDGTFLGSSDTMRFDGTNFVGQEHGDTMEVPSGRMTDGDIPLHEETPGSLTIRRNTRYVVELVSCGLQFAAKAQSGNAVTSNYAFDYTLGNNLQTTYTGLKWWDGTDGKQQAEFVPYLSFGAADIGG